jgi:hypothetical protein
VFTIYHMTCRVSSIFKVRTHYQPLEGIHQAAHPQRLAYPFGGPPLQRWQRHRRRAAGGQIKVVIAENDLAACQCQPDEAGREGYFLLAPLPSSLTLSCTLAHLHIGDYSC